MGNAIPSVKKSTYTSVLENPPQSQSADNFFKLKNAENTNSHNINNMGTPAVNPNIKSSTAEAPFQQNLNLKTVKENVNDLSNQNSNTTKNNEAEKQLQDMKIEYYKYKHQLSNLTETYKNLKSRADIEKKGPETSSTHGANCKILKNFIIFLIDNLVNVSKSYKEEKQINKNTVLILFVVSVLLGFFLSR